MNMYILVFVYTLKFKIQSCIWLLNRIFLNPRNHVRWYLDNTVWYFRRNIELNLRSKTSNWRHCIYVMLHSIYICTSNFATNDLHTGCFQGKFFVLSWYQHFIPILAIWDPKWRPRWLQTGLFAHDVAIAFYLIYVHVYDKYVSKLINLWTNVQAMF